MFMEIFDQLAAPVSNSSPRFTEKQGQYLAFIHTYTLLFSGGQTEIHVAAG